jgi:hypothetical protein
MKPTRSRPSLIVLLLTLAPAVFVLSVVVIAKMRGLVTFDVVMHDMATVADVHPLSGFVSRLGLLVWAAAAAVSLFGAYFVYRLGSARAGFLLASGMLSLIMLVDDGFMVHERLAVEYLGLSEKVTLGLIVMMAAAWLVAFRRSILEAGPFFLIMSVGMLGFSVFADVFIEGMAAPEYLHDWQSLLEDGPKFIGITLWLAFHAHAAFHFVSRAPATASRGLAMETRPRPYPEKRLTA